MRVDLGGLPLYPATILSHLRLKLAGRRPKLAFITDPQSAAWYALGLFGEWKMNTLGPFGEWKRTEPMPTVFQTPWGDAEIFTTLPQPSAPDWRYRFIAIDRDDPAALAVVFVNYVSP